MSAWCSLSESRLQSYKKGIYKAQRACYDFIRTKPAGLLMKGSCPVGWVMLTNYKSGGIEDESERFL